MKLLLTILSVFALAFAASLLFELEFILKNPPRYILVCLLMVFILWYGWSIAKVMGKSNQPKN